MNESPFEIEFKKQLIQQLKALNRNLEILNKELNWREHK